jgi:hypothetical protein
MSDELIDQKERLIHIADQTVKQLDWAISDDGNIEGAMHYINALSGIYSLLERIKSYEDVPLVACEPMPTSVEVPDSYGGTSITYTEAYNPHNIAFSK